MALYSNRHWRVVLIAGFTLTVLTFIFGLRYQNVTFQTDGIIYADTARQIATKHGISTRIVQIDTASPIPQTNWPPLMVVWFVTVGLHQVAMTCSAAPFAVGCGFVGGYLLRRFGWLAAEYFRAALVNTVILNVAAQPMSEEVFMGLAAITL